jgi:hypothetical protein
MQRQCRVQKGSHQGLVALGEQGRITAAAQFTDKGGARLLGMISVTDLIHIKV